MKKKNLLSCINFYKRNLADSKDGDDINLKGIDILNDNDS
jgi:hypothetical protein